MRRRIPLSEKVSNTLVSVISLVLAIVCWLLFVKVARMTMLMELL